jgi:hypothetical protein
VKEPVVLDLCSHDADAARAMKDELVAVHADARAELLNQSFYSAERFAERLDEHFMDSNFELVTGHVGPVLVGYAYGSTLPTNTWFWSSLVGVTDLDIAFETGSRTFWLREMLVRKDYQRRGYACRLHGSLLAGRSEERAVLFVRSDNRARQLYARWGWSIVGVMQPQPGIPPFEAMLVALPRN